MPSLAGTKLAKYEVLEEVGHGGMAVVYRGMDSVLKREVAIKVLHPHLADRPESRKRLEREAVAVAALRHENILEIFDSSGEAAGESYIVTEFIHGPTLREWLEDDYKARPAIAALVVHRLALALVHAHKAGIVHRDIKPENVMIRRDDGCIKLMDFGIAQILDNQKLTMTGQLIGSPAYMAPELINGRPLDARTDLFSLGILLYQLATGELPFAGRNPHEVLNRIADGNYASPSTVNPLVDADLEGLIAKALATNPDERFQSAESMAQQLEAYLAEMELEPNAAELRTYFQGATAAIADLDARVSKALMAKAQRAAQEGLHARALKLLGRVLEHDKDNKEARTMLSRLRVRAQRMRQMMLGAAALGLVGLVVAGAWLLPGNPWKGTIARADTVPKVLVDDSAKIDDGDVVDPSGEPPPVTDPIEPVASTLSGEPVAVVEPPDDGGGTTDGGGGKKPVGKPAGKPTGPTPVRTPPRTECTVVLDGIPLSTARNLKLKVKPTDGSATLNLPIDGLRIPVNFPGGDANASIESGSWGANKRLTRPDCDAGDVRIDVRPKAAKLVFEGAPNDLAVTCESGCPDGVVTRMAEAFPNIPFDPDSDSRVVVLVLKHEDFKPKSVKQTLHPGVNKIPADLEPRG